MQLLLWMPCSLQPRPFPEFHPFLSHSNSPFGNFVGISNRFGQNETLTSISSLVRISVNDIMKRLMQNLGVISKTLISSLTHSPSPNPIDFCFPNEKVSISPHLHVNPILSFDCNVVGSQMILYLQSLLYLIVRCLYKIYNQMIIALQHCVGFYQTSTWISHRFTMFAPTWTSLPPPSASLPSRLLLSPGLRSLSHTANSHWLPILYMVMYISMLLSLYIVRCLTESKPA